MVRADGDSLELVRLTPQRSWRGLGLGELWAARELVRAFVHRDLTVRYKQTVLGALWAIIQPVAMATVFAATLGRLGNLPSEGLPYSLFVLSGLALWSYASHALSGASASVYENREIITKVHFPRLVLPVVPLLSGIVELTLATIAVSIFAVARGFRPSAAILVLPLYVALAQLAILGAGLWLSALGAYYRDFRFLVPFLVQIWFFATPIAWSSALASEHARLLIGLNPMASAVEGFRSCLLGRELHVDGPLGVSVVAAFALVLSGLAVFRRLEPHLADVV